MSPTAGKHSLNIEGTHVGECVTSLGIYVFNKIQTSFVRQTIYWERGLS